MPNTFRAKVFCMASLLHYGLELAQSFNFGGICDSNILIVRLNYLFHVLSKLLKFFNFCLFKIRNATRFSFTFFQYAFLFKNSSVSIHFFHKNIQQIGWVRKMLPLSLASILLNLNKKVINYLEQFINLFHHLFLLSIYLLLKYECPISRLVCY